VSPFDYNIFTCFSKSPSDGFVKHVRLSRLIQKIWVAGFALLWICQCSSAYASDLYVVVGTNVSPVYLKAGEIRLTYRYYLQTVDSDHANGYHDLSIKILDANGGKLFGKTDISALGTGLGSVFYTKFYNPSDQWVRIYGRGGEGMIIKSAGAFYNLAPDGYVLGGDTPPASPTAPPASPPSSAPTPPTVNNPSPPRAQIHAVIVSRLADPSQVLTGSVNLTGGIIALGSPDSNTPQKAGRWDPNVTVTPDPELLNGDKIPPLVPNVIDVRIMHHEVSATIESPGIANGKP
jgi:hypothetical protein